jgi:hypothetical protein
MTNESKRQLLGGVGLTLVALACYGCWSKKEEPKRNADTPKFGGFPSSPPNMGKGLGIPAPPGSSDDGDEQQPSKLDFTDLKGILAGKWQKIEKRTAYSEPGLLDFTEKSVEETRYGFNHVGKFAVKDDLITFTDRDGDANVYGLEFVSDGEIALRPEKIKNGSDFNDLSGRWKRISLPSNRMASTKDTGPIADAKRQVQRIEAKLAKIETIQKSAFADRDELVAKLRAVGVNSVADLKGNIRGQTIAENLAKLATEIEGRERQLALIDTELLKAKSIVRRMEQEQAGLTQEELNALALQLRDLEDRSAAITLPITPIGVDSAVENALKGSPSQKKSK